MVFVKYPNLLKRLVAEQAALIAKLMTQLGENKGRQTNHKGRRRGSEKFFRVDT
jgi:hypothetical protein